MKTFSRLLKQIFALTSNNWIIFLIMVICLYFIYEVSKAIKTLTISLGKQKKEHEKKFKQIRQKFRNNFNTQKKYYSSKIHLALTELYSMKKNMSNTKNELVTTKEELENTRQELATTKEELENTRQELGNTNNELATTKEELENTRQELGNTNNELATTKEELVELADTKEKLANTNNELTTTKEELATTNEELNKISQMLSNNKNEFVKRFNKQETFIKDLEEDLKFTDVKTFLLNELIVNSEKNSNMKINLLNKKYDFLLNSYKILFFRKVANQILENLFYDKDRFYKTKKIFIDESKPINRQKTFSIIIAKSSINDVDKNKINLIIDFLMFLRDRCSETIHFSDKTNLYQLDFLTQILSNDKVIQKDRFDEYYLNNEQIINLLFDDSKMIKEEKIKIGTNLQEIQVKLDLEKSEKNIFSLIIEELEKIKSDKEEKNSITEFNTNLKEKGNIGNVSSDESNENTSSMTKNIDINNDLFNEIKKILYPSNNHRETLIIKLNDGINISKKIKEYNDSLKKLDNELKSENLKQLININYFYMEWNDSFNKGYRNDVTYKKLVKMETGFSLESLKNYLYILTKNYKIQVFKEDSFKFEDMIQKVISDEQINNY